MLKIVGPKTEKRLPHFIKQSELSPENIEDFFNDSYSGIRNKLIVELFYQTGIRLSELIELKISDISNNSIKVLGKRNKERILPIVPVIASQIEKYLAERTQLEVIKLSRVKVYQPMM
jgi:integrase/recombinase XerC